MNKLRNIFGNSVWQMMPSVFTLLLSLAVVRFFSSAVWGIIVSITVVQQVVNSIVSWGNKDFLQREMARAAAGFNAHFTALFRERFLLLLAVLVAVYFSGLVDRAYFFPFVWLVSGRFLQQSFDILIIKTRKFRLAIALEWAFLAFQVLALFALRYFRNDDISALLAVFWVPSVLKSVLLSVVFKDYFTLQIPSGWLLPQSFFFAALSITGLVHSKIDVLLVSKWVDKETLGHYQIVMAFLWNIQSAAMYISGPYVHNFYRLNGAARKKYARRLLQLGLIIVPAGVAATVLLLAVGFKMTFNWPMTVASLLFGAASFVYLPWILELNGENRESRVLLINVIGTSVLITLLLWARRMGSLTVQNLLWIVTLQQLLLTLAAYAARQKQPLWTR